MRILKLVNSPHPNRTFLRCLILKYIIINTGNTTNLLGFNLLSNIVEKRYCYRFDF